MRCAGSRAPTTVMAKKGKSRQRAPSKEPGASQPPATYIARLESYLVTRKGLVIVLIVALSALLRVGYFLELNAELAEVWPNITEKKDALADAEEWAEIKGKLEHLER